MGTHGKIEVIVQGVEIGDKVYCPFCAEETRRSSYGRHQDIEGYDYYCTCEGALENDRLGDELIRSNRTSEKIKHKQGEIPVAKDKLNRLKFEEGVRQLCAELGQPNPLTLIEETDKPEDPT